MSFDYPANWETFTVPPSSTHFQVITYLSTQGLSDHCDRLPNLISCERMPVGHLGLDGVFVDWSANSFFGAEFDPSRGIPLRVGGRRATLEHVDAGESCHSIGADRALRMRTDEWAPDNWNTMTACLRGPDLDYLQAQIEAMLDSVEWHR